MRLFSWFNKTNNVGVQQKYKLIIVSSIREVPEDTRNNIYVVFAGCNYKWVILMCPNNCGQRIEINLMKVRDPRWRIHIKRNKISLYPSVYVKSCSAHFWMIRNEIEWALFDNEI
jgi:hypothetical protein